MCAVLWRYVERPARDERYLELLGAGKGQDEDDEDREQLVLEEPTSDSTEIEPDLERSPSRSTRDIPRLDPRHPTLSSRMPG